MKGIPLVTAERIEKNRLILRFANGKEQGWTFHEGNDKPTEYVSIEMMSEVCLAALIKLAREAGFYLELEDNDQLDPFGRPISKGN